MAADSVLAHPRLSGELFQGPVSSQQEGEGHSLLCFPNFVSSHLSLQEWKAMKTRHRSGKEDWVEAGHGVGVHLCQSGHAWFP